MKVNEETIKVAVTMKEKGSDDDFELKWRWRKWYGRDDENVDEIQLKERQHWRQM